MVGRKCCPLSTSYCTLHPSHILHSLVSWFVSIYSGVKVCCPQVEKQEWSGWQWMLAPVTGKLGINNINNILMDIKVVLILNIYWPVSGIIHQVNSIWTCAHAHAHVDQSKHNPVNRLVHDISSTASLGNANIASCDPPAPVQITYKWLVTIHVHSPFRLFFHPELCN